MMQLLVSNFKQTGLRMHSILSRFKWGAAPGQRISWQVSVQHSRSNSTNPLDTFSLIGENLNYLEQVEKDLRKPSNQIPDYWRKYFDSVSNLKPVAQPARAISSTKQTKGAAAIRSKPDVIREPMLEGDPLKNHLTLMNTIKTIRRHGHLIAQIDPLRRTRVWSTQQEALQFLMPASAKNIPNDLDNTYLLPKEYSLSGEEEKMKLGQIYKGLFAVFGGPVGYEFEHIGALEKRQWMMKVAHKREETVASFTNDFKREALLKLSQAETLEQFMLKKYPTGKKFGLEGCEALIPGLHVFINEGVSKGTALFNFGMAHRGRLNVLVNVIEIELDRLFRGVRGSMFEPPVSGDVKYHWGSKRRFKRGKRPYELCLLHNPSHLETVCPLVLGKTAADRRHIHEIYTDRVWSVIMHGDSAMAGQGVVYETFNMAKLPQFNCNGTLHIAINNQIGFTANPSEACSMATCTDGSKVIEAPVFHVNADDVENVLFVFKSAAEYRAQFKEDVIINLLGYRRPGHNEMDDPRFTQPLMYQVIEKHPTAYTKYKEQAISQKIISAEELKEFENAYIQKLEDAKSAEEKHKGKQNAKDWVDEVVEDNVLKAKEFNPNLLEEALTQVEQALCRVPQSIKNVHPHVKALIEERAKYFKQGNVDWGMAEATLLLYLLGMRVPVRFSGVDAMIGGVFFLRQIIVTDQVTHERKNVIHEILDSEIPFDIANSPISHYGVLGYELGYSFCRKDIAVIWDARFGDCLNLAQILYDQYISSMEEKWGRSSGITLILPHGLEGEGPDLSSGRPERVLSLVPDDVDMMGEVEGEHNPGPVIANITTPANYFHILRQQYSKNVRKPLILYTLKKRTLLQGVKSTFAELKSNEGFKPYIPDEKLSNPHSHSVTKVLLCSGKVYFDIINERHRKNLTEKIAVGRVEQLYPLPRMQIFDDAFSYPNINSICWVQEEPMNSGCWSHVKPRLDKMFGPLNLYLTYIGREPSPSSAPSSRRTYLEEHQRFLDRAMSLS